MRKKIYSDKDKKPEKIEQNKAKEIAGLVIYCLIVIAAMFLIIKYVGQRTVVMLSLIHISDSKRPVHCGPL